MGFFDSLGQAFGFSSGYNGRKAGEQLHQFTDQQNAASNDYQAQLDQQRAQNQAIAGTNYQQNAQNVYGQQQNAASLLYNQATGKAASAADLQMQQGLANANNQSQSAMFSQQGGISPGLSQRNMLNAQAQQNAAIVGAGMVNRAAEQANAQQAYANQLGNMQQQQQNLGAFQLSQQQQALQNANIYSGQQMGARQNTANSIYGAQTNQLAAQTQANAAQSAALGNTISSAAAMLA